jgi:integrase
VVVDVARGVAPAPERSAPRGSTFDTFAALYLEKFARTHPSATSVRSEGFGVKYATAVLGGLALGEIDAKAAAQLKARYASSPANARKAWGTASRVLAMAVERGLVDVNIFAAMKAPKAPASKARFPRLEDLPVIERACLETKGVGAEIVRFLMRLPLRPDTAASLTWAEVDLARGELNLRPGAGRKFSGEQRLPLPSLAAELLADRWPDNPKPRGLVFGSDSKTNPGGKFSGWSGLYGRLRARSVGGWSGHDFRRSCVSLVAELRPDISEEALDRLLTHAQSSTNAGVKRTYQRAQGFAAMRAAADAWDEILRGALAANVVPLRRTG